MKIAVIGSGISGLGAAYYLSRRHDVTVFEAESRLGGHTNTITVDDPEHGPLAIDTGFIVCNPVNYPNFYRFLDDLGVARRNTDMSLGVSVESGRVEWAGDENLAKIFAQPSLMASPTHWRMLSSVLRFNREVKQCLLRNELPDITLGEFLDRGGYPLALRVRYIAAMAGPIWSTSTRGVMAFPFPFFARFFDSHGLLNVYERPQWQTVVGGSKTYVDRIGTSWNADVQTATPVLTIRRYDNGAELSTASGSARFDAIVCATHGDQALNLLDDPSGIEYEVLRHFRCADNEAWLHCDPALMPRRRRAWSAWNALLPRDKLSDEAIGVSYWMNRLQNLPGNKPYIVSLNPPARPRADAVLFRAAYRHPLYDTNSVAAQRKLPDIQGKRRIWWAGAWAGYGFHEDGFTSGLRAVAGIDPLCLPRGFRL